MGQKKRKQLAQESEQPAKRAQPTTVQVVHLASPDVARPVIASSPGVHLPAKIIYSAFVKQAQPHTPTAELLLQSSEHPTIDYLATESHNIDVGERFIKHYVAVFDPQANQLKVMRATKSTVRPTLRAPGQYNLLDSDDKARTGQTPASKSRVALTQAFGSKKSKKLVASAADNQLLTRGGDEAGNPVSDAILSSIKEEDLIVEDDAAGLDAVTDASRRSKPLPLADLSATDVRQVYSLDSLVMPSPCSKTLSEMPLSYWRERIAAGKAVTSRYRFIVHHVQRITRHHLDRPHSETSLRMLQTLRYIQLLLELHSYTSRFPNRKPLPPVEKWPEKTTTNVGLSTYFQRQVIARFFPQGLATQAGKTLLITTILALTLHIPPPKFHSDDTSAPLITEPSEISLDLALQPGDVKKLFRELGCRLETLSDAELTRYGWEKIDRSRDGGDNGEGEQLTGRIKFAKLKIPLDFPKVSQGRRARR